jgi:hypothetical protein
MDFFSDVNLLYRRSHRIKTHTALETGEPSISVKTETVCCPQGCLAFHMVVVSAPGPLLQGMDAGDTDCFLLFSVAFLYVC